MRLVEKYRPKTLNDVIGQEEVVLKLKNVLSHPDDLPHFLFVGPPGTGKTTVATCVARQLLGENWRSGFQELNASDDRGIETVRGLIKRYASLIERRILYLGESDNMTKDAQHALRRTMETTKNTLFILSGNYEHKYIEPILSRCAPFHFKKISDKDILRRIVEVCRLEKINVDWTDKEIRKGFEQLVSDVNGDLRKAFNILQTLIDENKQITAANVIGLRVPTMLKTAIQTALGGDFEQAKQIVEDEYIRSNFDSEIIFNHMYHALDDVKDREVKIRLYEKLGELERNVKLGTNPLVQFVAFIAYCWIAPHLPKTCPVLTKI